MTAVIKNLHEFAKTLPPDTTVLENQVAGHSFTDGKNSIGMLKQNDGKILKAATKEREITFYESIFHPSNEDVQLNQLREYIPEYHGIRTIKIEQKDTKFLVLENITKDMRLPCVMDIKIGRITWDFYATPEKIESEKKKYANTKNELGLSLPGFEVYNLKRRKLLKYGKNFGRSLNADTFKDSIRLFLNSTTTLNQHLVLQILGQLWRILYWFQKQRKLLFFSSSILLVYDAYRFINCETIHKQTPFNNDYELSENNRKNVMLLLDQTTPITVRKNNSDLEKIYLERNWHQMDLHSFRNIQWTEKEIEVLREDYFSLLDQHSITPLSKTEYQGCSHHWAQVKMIDFAHVFPSMDHKLDENYLEGLEMLVKIFEEFLLESFRV